MFRTFLVVTAASALLALTGASYETVAAAGDARNYPAPGVLVDVGGRRVHLNCTGVGSPTIILDAGLGGSSVDWALVQPELSTTTRTCAYDRAGMGWSDPAGGHRSPELIARELRSLLDRAEIEGPYVLVAHSLSGKTARLFAMHHPADVVGMVLIDARHEYVDDHTTAAERETFRNAAVSQANQYGLARQFGVVRLAGRQLAGASSMPADIRQELAVVSTRHDAVATTTAEALERAASDDLLRAAPSLGEFPLVAIAAGESMADPRWREGQRLLAALTTNGRVVVAQGSSHAVQWDQPDLVIALVREVVAANGVRDTAGHPVQEH